MADVPNPQTKRNRKWWIAGLLAVFLCLCLSGAVLLAVILGIVVSNNSLASTIPRVPSAIQLGTEKSQDYLNIELLSDPEGVLHLFWLGTQDYGDSDERKTIYYRQMKQDGSWTQPEDLTEGFHVREFVDYQPIVRLAPDESVCLFWDGQLMEGRTVISDGWNWRCRENLAWMSPEPIGSQDYTRVDLTPALTKDGSVQYVYDKPEGLFFGSTSLAGKPVTIQDNHVHFTIDSAGGYHLAWLAGYQGPIQYRYSADGGAAWQSATTLTEGSGTSDVRMFNLLADPKGDVHLFWISLQGVFHRRWNATSGWGATETVFPGEETAMMLGMACAVDTQGRGYVFWTQSTPFGMAGPYGARYSREQSDGHWNDPVWVAHPGRSADQVGDRLAIAVGKDGRVYFAWQVRYYSPPGSDKGSGVYFTSLP